MALRPSNTHELFARECSFPIDRESVVDAVGDVAITSPHGEHVDVEGVLASSDETTFASVTELHTTVMANLPDEYIGRKYYDDRSTTAPQVTELSF